jgi:uroporphyrinogen-III synthase
MQSGLAERGFEVVRLNTYDTLPVDSLPADVLGTAQRADVVAFASPSAVKAWHKLAGPLGEKVPAIACIGDFPKTPDLYEPVRFPSPLFVILGC